MKPRILMVLHQFRPVGTGAEIQAERLSVELVRMGHLVTVLTHHRVKDSAQNEVMQGIDIQRLKEPLGYWVLGGNGDQLKFMVKNRKSFDIIHAHMAFGHAVVAILMAKRFKKKCIVKLASLGKFGDLGTFSKFWGFKLALRVLFLADRVIAVSRAVEKDLYGWGFPADKVVRIPNGVDTQTFKRTSEFPCWKKVNFVFLGRLDPNKGIDVAIEAAKILLEWGMDKRFQIQIFGPSYPSCNFPKIAEEFGVSKQVGFFPFERDVRKILDQAHCLILPSKFEGLSNVLLEAMSYELPVIATGVDGNLDLVKDEDTGLLIPVGSPQKLAEAMRRIILCPEKAYEYAKNARNHIVKNFEIKYVAQRYSDLYNQLALTENEKRRFLC